MWRDAVGVAHFGYSILRHNCRVLGQETFLEASATETNDFPVSRCFALNDRGSGKHRNASRGNISFRSNRCIGVQNHRGSMSFFERVETPL